MGLNKADGIKQMLDALKSEKYALRNSELVILDEYIKKLYVKLLCTVIQYKDEPEEGQLAYLKRVISGIDIDDTLEVCMRKALEISEADVKEFLSIVSKEKYKYYWTLDGIVLLAMAKKNKESYEYFAELIELLEINKSDLEYISTVAKAVLEQSSVYFNHSTTLKNERVENLNFVPYIRNFYAGAIVDTESEKYYSAPDKELSGDIIYPVNYEEKRVVFENVIIEVKDAWNFNWCEEVIFSNCTLIGNNNPLNFYRVDTVKFSNCRVENFSNRVAVMDSINKFEVSFSEFSYCGKTCDSFKTISGGLFVVDGENQPEIVNIENSEFHNCYIENVEKKCPGIYNATGVVLALVSNSSKKVRVVNNKFIRCLSRIGGYDCNGAYFSVGYGSDTEESGNTYIGDLQQLFG